MPATSEVIIDKQRMRVKLWKEIDASLHKLLSQKHIFPCPFPSPMHTWKQNNYSSLGQQLVEKL